MIQRQTHSTEEAERDLLLRPIDVESRLLKQRQKRETVLFF